MGGAGQRTSCITLEQFKKSVLGAAVAAAHDPGMLDRHKDYMIMHSIRNKKRSKAPYKTSLPGLGDSLDTDAWGHPKGYSKSKSTKHSRAAPNKVVFPVI